MMIKYMTADEKRLMKKKARIAMLCLMLIGYVGFLWYSFHRKSNSSAFMEAFDSAVTIVGFLVVMVEYTSVFTDGVKAKIFEAGIGSGLKRREIYLAKFAEFALILFVDFAIIMVIALVLNVVLGVHLSGVQLRDLVITALTGWISQIGSMSFALIAVFGFASTTIGLIIFIAMEFQLDSVILNMLKSIKGLEGLTLANYTFGGFFGRFQSHLYLGTFSLGALIGMLVYLVLTAVIAIRLFRKRELEF